MQTYEIGKGIDLDSGATADGAAIDMSLAPFPFQPGGSAIAVLTANTWAEGEDVCALFLQGSDNAFSGWENLAEVGGGVTGMPLVMELVNIPAFLRWHQAGATAGDGRGSIYLLQQ